MQYLPTRDDVKNWNKIPCLRKSLMIGLGCGLGVSLLWGRFRRSSRGVVDGLFAGSIMGATVSWLSCRRNDRIRREAVQRMMLLQSQAPNMDALSAERTEMAERAREVANAESKKD